MDEKKRKMVEKDINAVLKKHGYDQYFALINVMENNGRLTGLRIQKRYDIGWVYGDLVGEVSGLDDIIRGDVTPDYDVKDMITDMINKNEGTPKQEKRRDTHNNIEVA